MIATVNRSPVQSINRLTLQVREIADETIAIRSQDWDRDRFDIEFSLDNGTTYNSFLIQGERTALIDTSHEKFRSLYMELLRGLISPQEIDYLVISHTEPDHSGLVKDILTLAPQITVVGSKIAIQFLEDQVHFPFERTIVKQGDLLDLGGGHVLEFVSAPNLHWPDTILTYDRKTRVLYTCDVFGMHYCDDSLYDEDLELLAVDYQKYYDCLMGPNARSVLSAVKRMADLPEIQIIATGHGPLLRHHHQELVERYRNWSLAQAKTETTVALFYMAGYGLSDRLMETLAHSVSKLGVVVEAIDMQTVDLQEARELVDLAAGLIIGMPAQSGNWANHTHAVLGTILAAAHSKQSFGLFETGGGDDESVYLLRNKLREIGLTEVFPPILVTSSPSEGLYHQCDEAGLYMGLWLTRDRTVKQIKTLDSEMEKAIGRISSGLYVVTAQKGEIASAMFASWVSQASFEPPGITVAVGKDRGIESLLHNGDQFVLNILEEGKYQHLMRHFLKRLPPGADRFQGVTTYTASNGCRILADALAYLECEVSTRLECSDHWIVYGIVKAGRVAHRDSLSAVHHRKIGNHY